MNDLEKAIFSTLAYFDIHKYPLTSFEIYKWLYSSDRSNMIFSFFDVLKVLEESSWLKLRIENKNGLYFLRGREICLSSRQENYRTSIFKSKIAVRMAKIFSFVPFCDCVCACNDFGFSSLNVESDIDMLIIAKKGRVYTVRLITVFITWLLRLRPQKRCKKDKICLSFYLAGSKHDLSNLEIGKEDVYLHFWLATLYPFFGFKKCLELIEENNNIISRFVNFFATNPCEGRKVTRNFAFREGLENLLSGKLGNCLEILCQKIQNKKLVKKSVNNTEKGVVVNEEMIKLHINDNRKHYFSEYSWRLSKKYGES